MQLYFKNIPKIEIKVYTDSATRTCKVKRWQLKGFIPTSVTVKQSRSWSFTEFTLRRPLQHNSFLFSTYLKPLELSLSYFLKSAGVNQVQMTNRRSVLLKMKAPPPRNGWTAAQQPRTVKHAAILFLKSEDLPWASRTFYIVKVIKTYQISQSKMLSVSILYFYSIVIQFICQ